MKNTKSTPMYKNRVLVILLAVFAPLALIATNGFYNLTPWPPANFVDKFNFAYGTFFLIGAIVSGVIATRGIVHMFKTRNDSQLLC